MENSFRTEVKVKSFPFGLGYKTPMLFIGSCFTENIGEMLSERKFPVLVNPNGVVYNPVSVGIVIRRIVEGTLYTYNDLQFFNELWYSFHHHSSFSSSSKEECLTRINSSLSSAHAFWQKANILVITFGTARVYIHKSSDQPVANCHKIPAREFHHRLLTVNEIVDYWNQIITFLLTTKPDLKIILTVSPVRHWKDGAEGNQLSKSTLFLAINRLLEMFSDKLFYFPAYEIMMDELRDYRFYADDMLHPSRVAIEYIWGKFKHAAVFKSDQALSQEIEKVIKNLNHKPFKTDSAQFKHFVENTLKKIIEIESLDLGIDFTTEKGKLKLCL